MIISQKTIDEVYDLSLEKVIGQYTELKKNGASFKATCPFHDEKTPSFHVSPAKGLFKCFGCGEGGNNAVSFIMKKERIQWIDAIKQLAQQHNITIEYDNNEAAQALQAKMERSHRYADLNVWAAQLYAENLKNAPPHALRCTPDIAERFNIGWADKSFDFLINFAHNKGISLDMLKELDLVRKSKNDYNTFRERTIFPIYNEKNMLVGFTGRNTNNEKQPDDKQIAKYINTADTPLYKKGNELYGIHLAKHHIIKVGYAYLVEGQWDVISMHARGLENTIGTGGTALTENQLLLIKKFTNHIVFIYDQDAAGKKALLKATRLAVEQGFTADCINLPHGQDPDEYFREDKNFIEM